jgi:hypothetical protein
MDEFRKIVVRDYVATGNLDLVSPSRNPRFLAMLKHTPPKRTKRQRDQLIGLMPSPAKCALEPGSKRRKVDAAEPFVLPPEIWFRIFKFLEFFELAEVRLVCKVFNELATDDSLWQLHYARLFFGDSVVPVHPWPVKERTCRMTVVQKKVSCSNPSHFIITNDRNRPRYETDLFFRTAERFYNLGMKSIDRRIRELSWKDQVVFRTPVEKAEYQKSLERDRKQLHARYAYVLERLYPKQRTMKS